VIVSIHQPAYLPWLGYFHKILRSDAFVVLDTVQIEKNGFVNRNRVRTPAGMQWLTVPLLMKGHTRKAISEMEINPTAPWKKKHIRTLEQAYGKRPHYAAHAEHVARLIEGAGASLTEFLLGMLAHFLGTIGLGERRIVRASELGAEGARSALLAGICRRLGADTYLSGAAGRDYLDLKPFEEAGVAVRFQAFRHPAYDQGYGKDGFEANMSVVDALFNCGAGAILPMLEEADGEG